MAATREVEKSSEFFLGGDVIAEHLMSDVTKDKRRKDKMIAALHWRLSDMHALPIRRNILPDTTPSF